MNSVPSSTTTVTPSQVPNVDDRPSFGPARNRYVARDNSLHKLYYDYGPHLGLRQTLRGNRVTEVTRTFRLNHLRKYGQKR